MNDFLLEFQNVSKEFRLGGLILGTRLVAVDGVSLALEKSKPSILSIVGESGSGKTTLAKIILKLHEPTSGKVLVNGEDIFDPSSTLKDKDYYRFVQPIFQNPFETFSMRQPVDSYLYDTTIKLGIARNRRESRDVIAETLRSVGLNIDAIAGKYPNQFSGGELQRISVARSLIPRPKLIVADEPVSMIDASLRMNIVNLFLELKETYDVSFVYITHDLATAYYVSDYIAIMYRGNVVEYGQSDDIMTGAAHPYTELLLNSVPTVDKKWEQDVNLPDDELKEYQTMGCKFANRCPHVKQICRDTYPPMVNLSDSRRALCYKPVDFEKGRTSVEEVQTATS